jgi:hypothetical protein
MEGVRSASVWNRDFVFCYDRVVNTSRVQRECVVQKPYQVLGKTSDCPNVKGSKSNECLMSLNESKKLNGN